MACRTWHHSCFLHHSSALHVHLDYSGWVSWGGGKIISSQRDQITIRGYLSTT